MPQRVRQVSDARGEFASSFGAQSQPLGTDAGFREPTGPNPDPTFGVDVPNPDPGFSAPNIDQQLARFRKALIGEFDREPEPLPARRNISKGQAIILGLAAAFNPEFGRSFVGPLLAEQINRPFQERALRGAERDRRIRIGSQIISTLETEQSRRKLQAEKDRRFQLDTDKFTEQKKVNKGNKELIDKRIEALDDKLQKEVLTDPRILALKRKADIIQDKLKRFINPLSGQIIKGKEQEAKDLATEEDLVIAQISELLNDLNVPKISAEDLGGAKPPPDPGSSAPRLVDEIFPPE